MEPGQPFAHGLFENESSLFLTLSVTSVSEEFKNDADNKLNNVVEVSVVHLLFERQSVSFPPYSEAKRFESMLNPWTPSIFRRIGRTVCVRRALVDIARLNANKDYCSRSCA